MTQADPKIIKSPLCQKFTADGIAVNVEIYKPEASDGWSLEVIDENWNSTVWDGLFATDQAAWDEFKRCVQEEGLTNLVRSVDGPRTIH